MKKILLSSLFFLIAFVANAQGIYTKVKKYDKFDDVVWEKDVKTIIDKGLSKITIETKGKKTVEYTYYDDSWFSLHNGRQDSLSNIVSDIYMDMKISIIFFQKIQWIKLQMICWNITRMFLIPL